MQAAGTSGTGMEENGVIEPLPDEEFGREVTSDYDPSDTETTFGSLTSSVTGHVWEYGRRYHAFRYGRYPLPNDDEEYKRESLRHAMLKELLRGKLYLAPIGDNPQKIIDLGTGFGEWAMESMFGEIPLEGFGLTSRRSGRAFYRRQSYRSRLIADSATMGSL